MPNPTRRRWTADEFRAQEPARNIGSAGRTRNSAGAVRRPRKGARAEAFLESASATPGEPAFQGRPRTGRFDWQSNSVVAIIPSRQTDEGPSTKPARDACAKAA